MKSNKRESRKPPAAAVRAEDGAESRRKEPGTVQTPAAGAGFPWKWILAAAGAVIIAFFAYSPATGGPFLFDDNYLPFATSDMGTASLSRWARGIRPVLMASYWFNARISGEDPWSYHILNILVHCLTSGLIFLIVRNLLERARVESGRRTPLAAFAALLFLLHPVQTEAVAYIAGRSEALSVMLVFAAFAVFLHRKHTAVSWRTAGIVLLLFLAAVLTKEHTVVFPALLLLTDLWWAPGSRLEAVRRNWKVYVPVVLGAAGGVMLFWRTILYAPTAGFGVVGLTWYQYLFTQFRALFVYIGQFVLPISLNADWEFAISQTIFDRGAIAGLVVLIALSGAALAFRRRFPLACYGFFVYLLLMSPTSSILPIKDPIAERRLYFSILGLILILVDLLSRLEVKPRTLAWACIAVLVAASAATYARAQVWADPLVLWQDNVRKSPNKARAHFNLAFAYYAQGRPELAIPEFEMTAKLERPTADLLLDWGLAYDSLNQPEEALAKLQEAALLKPSAHVYSQIGMIYGKLSRWQESLDALATAERLDPSFPDTYVNRGKVLLFTNRVEEAVRAYQQALALDPGHRDAQHDLLIAQRRLSTGR